MEAGEMVERIVTSVSNVHVLAQDLVETTGKRKRDPVNINQMQQHPPKKLLRQVYHEAMHAAREKRVVNVPNDRKQSSMMRREQRCWRSLVGGSSVSPLSFGKRKIPEQSNTVNERKSFADYLSARANSRSYQNPLSFGEEDLLIEVFERCMTLKSADCEENLDASEISPESVSWHAIATESFTSDDGYNTMRSHDDVEPLSSSLSFEIASLSGASDRTMGVDDRVHVQEYNDIDGSVATNDNELDIGFSRPRNQLQSAIVPTNQQHHDNVAGSSTEIPQEITDMIKTLRQEATIRQNMKRHCHRELNVGDEEYGEGEVENKRGRLDHLHHQNNNVRHKYKISRRCLMK